MSNVKVEFDLSKMLQEMRKKIDKLFGILSKQAAAQERMDERLETIENRVFEGNGEPSIIKRVGNIEDEHAEIRQQFSGFIVERRTTSKWGRLLFEVSRFAVATIFGLLAAIAGKAVL